LACPRCWWRQRGETTATCSTRLLAEYDGESWAYHVDDGLGSVRQLADADGQVTLAQGYAPFGERYGVKQWVTGFGFTGSGGRLTPGCCSCGRGTTSRRQVGSSVRIRGRATYSGHQLSRDGLRGKQPHNAGRPRWLANTSTSAVPTPPPPGGARPTPTPTPSRLHSSYPIIAT